MKAKKMKIEMPEDVKIRIAMAEVRVDLVRYCRSRAVEVAGDFRDTGDTVWKYMGKFYEKTAEELEIKI